MFDQRKMSNRGQLKQEDNPESEQHSSTSKMSAPRKEVVVAQDAMEDDSDNQMKGTITAQQDTTEVKFGAKELVTEAYHK
jgi:hypothetical protein